MGYGVYTMKLTQCEADQFIEFMRLWFARNGGVIDQKIKSVNLKIEDGEPDFIMPPRWNKHEPCKDSEDW